MTDKLEENRCGIAFFAQACRKLLPVASKILSETTVSGTDHI
jgi:hypothetical protein